MCFTKDPSADVTWWKVLSTLLTLSAVGKILEVPFASLPCRWRPIHRAVERRHETDDTSIDSTLWPSVV